MIINLNVDEIPKKVIPQLKDEFDSHDFHKVFALEFEKEYILHLVQYMSFQQSHAMLGKWIASVQA